MQKIIFSIILFLFFCNIITSKKLSALQVAKKTDYKVYRIGYVSNKSSRLIVTTENELLKQLLLYWNPKQVSLDYPNSFFEKNNLVFIYYPTTSGSYTVRDVVVQKKGNKVSVNYYLNVPRIHTCDMSGFLITVPVEKTITELE